jgi:hypothetical protein
MTNPQVPTIADPKLVDLVTSKFNPRIATRLTWLNYVFGQCQILTKESGKKVVKYPSVYAGENVTGEYANVLPSEELGNTMFWLIGDPLGIETAGRMPSRITGQASLIFWFNLEAALGDATQHRNLDKIKLNVLQAIRYANGGFNGEFKVTEVSVRAENIYSEFSLRETDQQFLMHPWAGLRINGDLTFFEGC